LGIPVIKPKITEITALGAAYAAGLAVGVWKPGDKPSVLEESKVYEPTIQEDVREMRLSKWKDAVQRTLNWA
jgi:glycerol kinase